MERNDYLNITTYEQLRTARRATSEELSRREASLTGALLHDARKLLLSAIRRIRSAISGTPFAKP